MKRKRPEHTSSQGLRKPYNYCLQDRVEKCFVLVWFFLHVFAPCLVSVQLALRAGRRVTDEFLCVQCLVSSMKVPSCLTRRRVTSCMCVPAWMVTAEAMFCWGLEKPVPGVLQILWQIGTYLFIFKVPLLFLVTFPFRDFTVYGTATLYVSSLLL